MDPIEKIIDRLKKEHGENGIYYLLETWYKKDLKNPSYKENIYNNVMLGITKKDVGTGYDVILHPSLSEVKNECVESVEKTS